MAVTHSAMTDTPAPATLTSDEADRLYITLNRLSLSGLFVSGLAHELNNPLQVVNGTVELLLARQDLPADVVTKLQRVAAQVDRASGTLQEVLAFVRDRTYTAVPIDLRRLIEQAVGLRRYPLARAGITAIVEPPPPGVAMLHVRPTDIVQALLNLIINAETAMAGRQGSELHVQCEAGGEVARVRVSDNGPGLPPESQERLFTPFFSTHGVECAGGLGLPAAAAIIRHTGGRLWAEDVPAGASFVIELPIKPPRA